MNRLQWIIIDHDWSDATALSQVIKEKEFGEGKFGEGRIKLKKRKESYNFYIFQWHTSWDSKQPQPRDIKKSMETQMVGKDPSL